MDAEILPAPGRAELADLVVRLQGLGLNAYMRRPDKDSYLYFSDGQRIGYAQYNRVEGWSASTCHKPNRATGTGFQVVRGARGLTDQSIEAALAGPPSWASSRDRAASVSWLDWRDFLRWNTSQNFPLYRVAVRGASHD